MARRRPALIALAASIGSLFAPAPAARGQQAPAPAGSGGIRRAVTVTAIDLDVVATKDGQPVNDLTKDEILVEIAGKKTPVDYFARVEAGSIHGPDLANASPDVILDAQASPDGGKYVPRQFLLFFDDSNLLPHDRKRVIEGLRDFVTRLSPSDRVSLVAYGTATRVFVPWTASKEALLDGLGRLETIAPSGLSWESQFQNDLLEARRSRPTSREAIIRNWGAQATARSKGLLEELTRAVSALSARSGKRAMLFVSNGFEIHPGQTFFQALGPGSGLGMFDWNVSRELDAAIAEANRSGVTIHALAANGLATDTDASSSAPPVLSAFYRNQNFREPLAAAASETGGILVENRNDFRPALERIYRASSSYYSLGVTLSAVDTSKGNPKVRVTSTRPGVVLTARRNLGAKTGDEAARDRIEMALMTPDASGDFTAPLSIGPPTKGGGIGRRLVPYKVAVSLADLTFVDEGGKKKAVLDILIAATDDAGARSPVVAERKTVTVEPAKFDAALKQTYVHAGELKSRTGNMRFVVGVRDLATGRTSVAQASVRVD